MDGSDNLYSRLVTGFKILLPLGAIMLLSTMFLFARKPAEDPAIPYAEIEDIAREPRITEPNYAGIAEDGSLISIAADEVRPDPDQPDAFTVTRLRAEVDATDGSRVEVSSGNGRIDPRAQTAVMGGLVRLITSSGYAMETSGLTADLSTGRIQSTGPLEVQAPFGALSAGGLVIQLAKDGRGQQMVFNDGVTLLYQP